MEELIDLVATDSSAAKISDQIKGILYTKAAERVDSAKPIVSTALFDGEYDEENSNEDND